MVMGDFRQLGGRRLQAVLALVAAGVLLAAFSAAAAPAAAAPVPSEFFGMSAVSVKNKDFPRMARGGIGTYRTVIPWLERGSASGRSIPSLGLPLFPDDPDEETEPDDPASPGEPDGSGGSGGSGPPDPNDWNYADIGIRKAAASGIEPLAVLSGSPPSVARNPRTPPLASQQAREGWQSFVRASVSRYGPDGEFWRLHPILPYKPVRVWQVWN